MTSARSFEVAIAAHVVPARPAADWHRRFSIEAQTHTVVEVDEQRAIAEACRRAHIVAGVAKWRPYLRESMTHASARRVQSVRELEMERVRRGARA